MDNFSVEINYCSRCGSKIDEDINQNDRAVVHICKNCDAVYYENPKIIVLSLIDFNGKVLLCKRAIKPRLGYWTLLGGYMEKNETARRSC